MAFERIFHPVGQGAFYTERHEQNGSSFTVVYDCGSGTSFDLLKKYIDKELCEDSVIDILFISHFHNDHINGLKYLKDRCQIKNVIIPLLHDNDRIILKAIDLINEGKNAELIDNPRGFFDESTNVIEIKEDGIQNDPDYRIERGLPIGNLNETSHRKIPSGITLTTERNIDWIYQPFNFRHDDQKYKFIEQLKARGLELSHIDTDEKINMHKCLIREAYDSVLGDLNSNSLVLYSGAKENRELSLGAQNLKSNCIYMGDIFLKKEGLIDEMKDKGLKLSEVETIQIPHHGAEKSFDKRFLDECLVVKNAVISYGIENRYNHPGEDVKQAIISTMVNLRLVTEDSTTEYSES